MEGKTEELELIPTEGLTGLKLHHAKKKNEAIIKKGIIQQEKSLKKDKTEESTKEISPEAVNEETPVVKETKKSVIMPEEKDPKSAGIKVDVNKTYEFELLEKTGAPRHVLLNCTSKVFDGERIREIKYIPIADTVFTDQMGDRYDHATIPILSFNRDRLTVEGSDTRLVEFMLLNDEYDGNKKRLGKKPPMYTLINKSQEELDKEAKFLQSGKAMNAVNDGDINELIAIARVIYNETSTDEVTVRNVLRTHANKDPKTLLDNINSPQIKRRYVIQKALDQGIIEVNKQKRSLVWAETGSFIMEVIATNNTKSLVIEIADFTFKGDGQRFYEVIKNKLAS